MVDKIDNVKYNVLVMGVSCFDGMASTTRVMNLLEPLQNNNLISLNNLIYDGDTQGLLMDSGILNGIGYRIIFLKNKKPFSFISFYRQGFKFLKKSKSDLDKNILYNYQQVDAKNLMFLVYAKLIGYKVILDIVEDNEFYTNYPNFLNKLKLRSSVFLLKLTPKIADAVLAISTHLHNKFKPICKVKIPVYLVPITVNFQRFKITPKAIKVKNLKIFYGGSFGEKDGLEYLIGAFNIVCAEFADLRLIFTGKGSPVDTERIEGLIANSKYKNQILYKGFLDSDKYYEVLNDCDIFCMTRINSSFANAGFPFKLGEFLASGKAVISTTIGDIPNYLTDNLNALLIRPNSQNDLINALLYLLRNPTNINKLGVEGKKIASEHFDSDLVSKKLLQIFKTL